MALIGYARVSTLDQSTTGQAEALRAAGCTQVHEESASGGDRSRPVLARLVETIRPGDTLMVVRIDRLARSLSHLLQVVEDIQARGGAFRSLQDPIDTASPQGKFTLQVLGAAAEFERALIRERTLAGLETARRQGRVGGNPGLRDKDPAAIRKIGRARADRHFDKLTASATQWVPIVRQLRPHTAWEDVVKVINARLPAAEPRWTIDRLTRAVRAYVRDGLLPRDLLSRAPPRLADDRLLAIVAAIKGADPDITLQDICARLEAMHERTPRGRRKWHPSSVHMLIERARRQGLLR